MQQTVNNQDIENLDLSKIAALQQKRTLAFVNHFVLTTVQFLNTFTKTCEHKLKEFEEKLEKVDAAMVLLEARLSSIPEINDIATTSEKAELENSSNKPELENSSNKPKLENSSNKPENQAATSGVNDPNLEPENIEQDTENKNHTGQTKPEYLRFIKMIQVGVPLEAVKLKVSLEGLDPKELENLLKK